MTYQNACHICALLCLLAFSACRKENKINPPDIAPPAGAIALEASPQRSGDVQKGYNYLIYGDYINSGIPLSLYQQTLGGSSENLLNRTGDNFNVRYDFTAIDAFNGVRVAAANCLQCHAQKLNGELIVGLGNSFSDFTFDQSEIVPLVDLGITVSYGNPSKEWDAFQPFRRAATAVGPEIKLNKKGVNPADKITAVLAAHRNQDNLTWFENPQFEIPEETVPTDVPALWLLKKKNVMFAAGVGRGDFARIMMASSILTLQDSAKARVVDQNFVDVATWIRSLEAPVFPGKIDSEMAERGEVLFLEKCAKCHGTYGDNESYPNLLVPLNFVQTDPMLTNGNFVNPKLVEWYNGSWFGQGAHAAQIVRGEGYIAPPLDGVWATAPYLHNASVPTLDDLLNSAQRPTYFKRSFDDKDYDFEKVGWNYTIKESGEGAETYNTKLPGYGNQGHYYGDVFTEVERMEVIEYLKTL